MADNVLINQGVGTTVATKERGTGVHEQAVVAGLHLVRSQQTPTINTSAYTSGDELGTLMTITGAARYTGGGGLVRSITVLDKTQAQRSAIDILLFTATITVAGNNNPFLPSDADMLNFLGSIPIATGDYNTTWAGTPTNSAATKLVEHPYICTATSLFALAVVRGTPTYTSTSDIVISFTLQQN